MTKSSAIIKAIDEYLEKNHLDTCTPVEISPTLERMGLLNDRTDKPGLPLRILLRKKKIPHAYQIGRSWYIPHSDHRPNVANNTSQNTSQIQSKNYSHSFEPIIGDNPKILILGSMPGKESLRMNQYYAKAGNRFWDIMAKILKVPKPISYDDKIRMLENNNIALWDVLESAEREGSLDINIKNDKPNDIINFLHKYPSIKTIGFNGKKAYEKFSEYFDTNDLNIKLLVLLSTSPANCQFSDMQMIKDWSKLL